MEIQADFKKLLTLFNTHEIEYTIVGGYALAFHGAPRFTGDLDIHVKPDIENARRVIKALDDFGFKSLGLTPEDFSNPDNVIQLGYPPVRIDIITSLSGVTSEEVFLGRIKDKYGDITVYYIGREQLIANKRATGRKRDIADLEALGEE
ncbi:nucleotidyltransferase family protein [bacterium]|nr:nucleotidyltransferase family protein [bacterium]